MCNVQLSKISIVIISFFFLITFSNLTTAAVNTANCNTSAFSNVPVPDNALSINIDTALLVPAAGLLPEYCDVKGYILTSPPVASGDNQIKFQVKMPTVWNKKFLMHGGPGNVGNINFSTAQVIAPSVDGDRFVNGYGLAKGYTIAATDTGHVGASTIDSSNYRNPDGTQNVDKIVNFGYRAVHLVAVASKSIMDNYYQQKPKYSYFVGTSNGGRQGIIEAERYPNDFNGVIAAAPAWNLSGTMAKFVSDQLAQYPIDATTAVITNDKLPIIASAVMQKCDAKDGIVDSIISDPIGCNFNALTDVSICPANTNDSTCITLEQANVLDIFLSPVITPYVFNLGYLPGYENSIEVMGEHYGRPGLLGASPNLDYAFVSGYLKYLIYNNPSYDIHSFNLYTNSEDLVKTPSGVNLKQLFDANSNISKFQKNGGKLIIIHGLADNVVPPASSIHYYLQVGLKTGIINTLSSVRLFLMPGVYHFTTFSPGVDPNAPTRINVIDALDNWVVNGIAPNKMIASRSNSSGVVDMTRPICPFPLEAKLKEGLDANSPVITSKESNFYCGIDF
jgi:feruloyl esterase